MDNRKFELLIDLIINENTEQARALFHDIVVEKSREIYESIMDEEMMDNGMMGETSMVGEVGDLMNEIDAEESGMTEDEEFVDAEIDDGDEVVDMSSDDMDDDTDELEDRVLDIEDKLDMLLQKYMDDEEEDEEEDDEEDMEDEEESEEDLEDMEDEEESEEDLEDTEGDEEMEKMMEAIALKKVTVSHGDNGAYTKSPSLNGPKVKSPGVNPVRFSGHDESVPTSPKGPSNQYSKGETQVKHAGQWKNSPAQAGQDLESAPKAHKAQATGVNTKSPVNESKRSVKKRVK